MILDLTQMSSYNIAPVWNQVSHEVILKNMKQRIDLLKQKEKEINNILNEKEQDLIYFKSIQNFLLYVDQFKNETEKEKVVEKIEKYFLQIEENNFSFLLSDKLSVLKNIISPIAFYYKLRFNFRFYIGLKYSLFIGLNIDAVLLIFGILKNLFYVPIVTIILFLYWLFIEIFYAKKNKIY